MTTRSHPRTAPTASPADVDALITLVGRAQNSDAAAFEQLVGHSDPMLLAVIRRWVNNPDDAADILQEVWARVAVHLGSLQDPARFQAWASRIARHCTIDFLRARRTERACTVTSDFATYDVVDQNADQPELATLSTESVAELGEALARLSPADRDLLAMREVDGLPYEEIAQRLQISPATAQVRAFRARQRLREQFARALELLGCTVTEERLIALLDGGGGRAEALMLWRHVTTCRHCEYRLRFLRQPRKPGRAGGRAA